ncbi:hypothetical protein LCGC14_0388900 [marine sediment metagenome]|uniref:Uncharacterized protein n=1 Tax=marine sediment metagenome TaxID=412755 RepID=A0A0F9W9C2_9ZZZZ
MSPFDDKDFNPKLPVSEWAVKHLLCCQLRLLESVNDPETLN